MTRQSTSRPSVSVPKGCSGEGGRRESCVMVVESASVGLPSVWGTQRSAVRATRIMSTIQTAPKIASLFLRRRLQASPHRVRAGADVSMSPSVVTGLSVTSFFSISSVMSRTSYSLLPAPYLMRGSRKA